MDPEARHGHKTSARGFDGYKGHIAIDPDSEVITATEVTAGNVADGSAAEAVLADILTPAESAASPSAGAEQPAAQSLTGGAAETERAEVYGDASYGTATLVERLEEAGVEPNVKVQGASPPRAGLYSQDDFTIDTTEGTVCCPQGVLVALKGSKDGSALAEFGAHCTDCPRTMHDVAARAHGQGTPAARHADPAPEAPAGSCVAQALSRDAAQGRTKDHPPDEAAARWPSSAHAGVRADRPRLRAARRRGEPAATRTARHALYAGRLGGVRPPGGGLGAATARSGLGARQGAGSHQRCCPAPP